MTAKNIINRLLKTNHRLRAFNLGNIISDEHSIKGSGILPNPPINIGIIIEGIINIPWNVIHDKAWSLSHSIIRFSNLFIPHYWDVNMELAVILWCNSIRLLCINWFNIV